MEITQLSPSLFPQAATLFSQELSRLRQSVTALPDTMVQPDAIKPRLGYFSRNVLAAVENDQLLGYLGWFEINHFRDTPKKAAYCPVWGHASLEEGKPAVYRALYRSAAQQWQEHGCQMMAITSLADDQALRDFWFWNGFGLVVVDSIRPCQSLGASSPAGVTICKAGLSDAAAIATLDKEHRQHYSSPPVWMAPRPLNDEAFYKKFLAADQNNIFLAEMAGELVGLLQFEAESEGAAEISLSPETISITGSYVKPKGRGMGINSAMLDAAMRHYAALGYTRCAVDFESVNPEATAFWNRYFTPVCFSVFRHPEAML